MRLRLVEHLVSAMALVAVVSGCSLSGLGANNEGIDAAQGYVRLIKAPDRVLAPDLSGSLLGGGHDDLSSYAGRVLVLNVWAAWCGYCRAESPGLVRAAAMLPTARFIGIDIRDDEGSAEAFVRSHGVPYPSFFDQDARLVLQLQSVVRISGQPITVILDKQRRVAAEIFGPTTTTTLRDIIRPLQREA